MSPTTAPPPASSSHSPPEDGLLLYPLPSSSRMLACYAYLALHTSTHHGFIIWQCHLSFLPNKEVSPCPPLPYMAVFSPYPPFPTMAVSPTPQYLIWQSHLPPHYLIWQSHLAPQFLRPLLLVAPPFNASQSVSTEGFHLVQGRLHVYRHHPLVWG